MPNPSTMWFIVIIMAACLLAAANIYYPLSKQAEEKRSMAISSEQILEPELESNLELAKKLKADCFKSFEHFDNGAWLVVSNGNLLLGIESKKRNDLIKAYALINKANEYLTKIQDQGFVTVVGANSVAARRQLVLLLQQTLKELEPLLISLTKK